MLCTADRVFHLIRDRDKGSHLDTFLRGFLESNSEHNLNLDLLGTGFRFAGGTVEGLTNMLLVF